MLFKSSLHGVGRLMYLPLFHYSKYLLTSSSIPWFPYGTTQIYGSSFACVDPGCSSLSAQDEHIESVIPHYHQDLSCPFPDLPWSSQIHAHPHRNIQVDEYTG